MGGNALKNYETGRLPREDYFTLVAKFEEDFLAAFGQCPILIVAYGQKESFGDADFLVASDNLPPNWTDILKEKFNLTEEMYKKNGDVVSIGYHNFQVDLILTPWSKLDAAFFYFSFNDFGNLIGRIGHKMGFKVGHHGLSIVVRGNDRGDHILKEIYVTDDYWKILSILGLDPNVYDEGFDTLEEMFQYVASSKYFDPEIYSLEHRSHKSRIRDRKRATYSKFLDWVAETKPVANHSFPDKSELGGYNLREPYYSEIVLKHFPWVKQEVDQVIEQYQLDQEFAKVYNGEFVTQQTGYTGKTLGAFMALVKPYLTNDVKRQWIKSSSTMYCYIANKWVEVGGLNFGVENE